MSMTVSRNRILKVAKILILISLTSGCESDTHSTLTADWTKTLMEDACDKAESYEIRYRDSLDYLNYWEYASLEDTFNNYITMIHHQNECDIFTTIQRDSTVLYKKLSEGIVIPLKVYLFQFKVIKDADKDTGYATIGFIKDISKCKKYNEQIRSFGYDVKPCYSRTLFWKVAWI